MLTETALDEFTRSYIEAMLWSSADDDGTPLDQRYSFDDLSPETVARIVEDCKQFQRQNAAYIADGSLRESREYSDVARAGHDFWLTRVGHGAGFWDGDWAEEAGESMTQSSQRFGNLDLYAGDDGKLYF